MSKVEGVAKRYDDTPVDYVSIFNWSDGQCIAQIIPDISGAWEYEYFYDLNVGITYVSDGCEPLTHGAYDLLANEVSGRYWRISGVVSIADTAITKRITMKELRFITASGVLSDQPAKAAARSFFGTESSGDKPGNAFDGKDSTVYHPSTGNAGGDFKDEWISYDFTTPEVVIGVTARFRTESYAAGWRFKSAVVEYSSDGVNWNLAGYANIKNDIATYTFEGDIEDTIKV